MNMQFTNKKGVSYYKSGKRYYCNTGWLEVEISKAQYEYAKKAFESENKK